MPLRRKRGWLFVLILLFLSAVGVVLLRQQQPLPESESIPLNNRPYQQIYSIHYEASQNGWTAERHRRIGIQYFELGDLENAASHWQAALLLQPDNINLLRQLSETYLVLHKWSYAVDTLRQLLTLVPNELWAHYQLGLILAPLNSPEAITHLQRVADTTAYGDVTTRIRLVLRSDFDEASKAVQIGIILAENELWAHAEGAFQQAANLSVLDGEALAYTGLARGMQGKSGLEWIRQAITLDPTNPTVRYLEGVYLRNIGEYAGSIDAFSLALSFDPTNPAYYVELGNTYRKIGDLTNANRWLIQSVAISNYDSEFQKILNDFYLEEGARLIAAGIDTPPAGIENADAEADVAWTLYQLGAVEQANTTLEKALSIEASNPRALFYQARIAIEEGEIETARALLDSVIAANDDFVTEAEQLRDALSS
jgi:tetratricopeptide (TPR) repeat protein